MKSALWKTLCMAYPAAIAHFFLAPQLRDAGPLPKPRRWDLTVPIRWFLFHLGIPESALSWPVNPDLANETRGCILRVPGKDFPHFERWHKRRNSPSCLPLNTVVRRCDDWSCDLYLVSVRWLPKEESQQMKTAKQKNRKHLGAWCAPDLTNPKNLSLDLLCVIIRFTHYSCHI